MEKMKALVIDDEQIVLDSVRKILTDENYEVDVSLSGREGLSRAIHKEYDIVLTDIRMPDIGGMRVLRDVRRARPSLPYDHGLRLSTVSGTGHETGGSRLSGEALHP